MKVFIYIGILLASFSAAAQPNAGPVSKVQYIGASITKGHPAAVIVDNVPLVHTKQFLPVDKNGSIVGKNNPVVQIDQIFRNISNILKESGSKPDDIIKLNIYVTEAEIMRQVQTLISRKFQAGKAPSLAFAIGKLSKPEALVAIDAIAVSNIINDRVNLSRSKSGLEASSAVLPPGPVVYISGQAANGELAEATRGTLKQLGETLKSLGLSKKDVVQIKTFLTPMSSLNVVRKQFSDYFKDEIMPPLVFVEWVSANPVVEIELIAASPFRGEKNQIEYITPPGMMPSPVYSKVAKLNFGKKVYLSGIYGLNSGNPDSEVNSVFESMADVLKSSGSSFNHLLKATYYVASDQFSKSLTDLRPKYYDPKRPPAASKAMLKEVGLNGPGISIDMIGTVKE